MPSRRTVAAAASVACLLALAACGQKPTASSTDTSSPAASSSTGTDSSASAVASQPAASSGAPAETTSASVGAGSAAYKACMVLDTGGVNDKSFNQSAWAGMQAASKADPKLSTSYVSSASQNDYAPNLANEVGKGCASVVAVGGLMTDAVKASAKQHPKQQYAIIDSATGQPNVYSIQFDTAQGGFLGGYLAAAMSGTGKVGTFGGIQIPPVTIYMDGFYEGVQYYNKTQDGNVAVLGWNEKTQTGTFTNSFTDPGAGRSATNALVNQGADIVFPVAGGAGLGAGAAAQAAGGKLKVIWVDVDGCQSAAEYCKYFLSTVFKGITGAVQKYVTAAATGKAAKGGYVGTLANGGTGLSPFHDFADQVPQKVKDQLTQVGKDITSGKITITSKAQPAS